MPGRHEIRCQDVCIGLCRGLFRYSLSLKCSCICCSLNTLHDEVRHPFELELSWICEETKWQHHLVPDNLRDEVNEWAVQSIKEDEMADDDDDDE